MHCSRRLSLLIAAIAASSAFADAGGESSVDPPGLKPLVTQGDSLLAAGQYSEAARSYSDAIGLLFALNTRHFAHSI